MPSPFGVGPAHEKKIGHRRVDASGETTYKKAGFSFSSFSLFVSAVCFVSQFQQLFSTHTLHCSFSVVRLQTTSSALQGAIQLGIGYTVGNLSSKPERDVLMQDFYVVESIFFPRCACARGMFVHVHACHKYLIYSLILFFFFFLTLPVGLILLHAVKGVTSLQPIITQTLGLKPTPL